MSGPPYTYTPSPSSGVTLDASGEVDSFDFDAFVAMLSGQGQTNAGERQVGDTTSATSAYSFLPSGLVSTATPEKSRSDIEQKLYDYGNEVGSYIQSFEEQNAGMTQALKNQVEDRNEPAKAAAVVAVANALRGVGESLTGMDSVPSQMTSPHSRLAKSYIEIGNKLAEVPKAQGDSDFIKAIEAYNAAADVFVKNYVAVAELFGAYGIAFTMSDAGAVFTFTPTGL